MNNKNTLALVALAVCLGFAPAASAAYGDMVTTDSDEWTVTLTDIAGTVDDFDSVLRHNAGTTNNFFDDVFVLDVDNDDQISQYDYVLATDGYDGSAVGELVMDDMTLLAGDEDAAYASPDVFDVDADENGRLSEGDYVFICDDDSGVHATTAAGGADPFCIALTDAGDVSAGDLVRTNSDVLEDWDGVNDNDWAAEFCIFDADTDGAFQGGDDMDLAWLVDSATCNTEGVIPIYSLELFGDGLTFGDFVTEGTASFTANVIEEVGSSWDSDVSTSATDIRFFRNDAGTANNFFDDVIIFDVDDDNVVSQFDFIVASAGYDGSEAGGVIEDDMTLLTADADGDVQYDETADDIDTYSIDVNENGSYDTDDYILLCLDNGDDNVDTLFASDEFDACVNITATGDGSAGGLVRTSHDLLDDWQGNEDTQNGAEYVYFDADTDADFNAADGEDLSWLSPVAGTGSRLLPSYSVVLFGDSYGDQVAPDSDDFVLTLDVLDTLVSLEISRHDAGTTNNFFDDVFVLDTGPGAGDEISQYDFVLASGGYDGSEAGGLIEDEMSLLNGDAPGETGADLILVDANEDGNYGEEDYVFVCDTDTGGLHATTETAYCIAITEAGDLSPGDLVRTNSDILDDWGADDFDAGFDEDDADFCFYDSDDDGSGDFEGQDDLAWLDVNGYDTDCDGEVVELFNVQLYGDFSNAPGGGGDTTTDDDVTTDDGTTDDGSDDDKPKTPGFEVVALVAALGAALVLVRRKL